MKSIRSYDYKKDIKRRVTFSADKVGKCLSDFRCLTVAHELFLGEELFIIIIPK